MHTFPSAPDEDVTLELLERIEAGESDAWNELYRRYHDRLLFAVRVRLGRGLRRYVQSEDVLQSVALEAFQSLGRFEYRGPGSLQRYLQKMVINKVRDLADTFGAAKRAGAVQLDEAALGAAAPAVEVPEPSYYDAERYEHLERSLGALPEDMREILLLRKVDGLSSKEVADAMGKTDAAIRKAYSRALARLTTLMSAG